MDVETSRLVKDGGLESPEEKSRKYGKIFAAILSILAIITLATVLARQSDDDDDDNQVIIDPTQPQGPSKVYESLMADRSGSGFHLYTSGQIRRATDPVTPEEVDAAMLLLFGDAGKVDTLDYADSLLRNPKGFGGLARKLKSNEMIYPENVKGFSFVPGPYKPFEAEKLFMAQLKENNYDLPRTMAWARANEDVRSSLRTGTIGKVLSWVADEDKDEIIAAEYAIERGEVPSFHRYILVDFSNGISDVNTENGDVYQTRVRSVIDITDIRNPFISESKTEVTKEFIGNVYQELPENAVPRPADYAYIVSFAEALYGEVDPKGKPRQYVPHEGTNPFNIEFRLGNDWSKPQKFFVQPFRWLKGESAELYGEYRNETLMQASLIQYTESIIPVDGHSINTGSDLFDPPLSLVYSVFFDMVAPENLLPGSSAISLNWYGRGLSFTPEAAQRIGEAVVYTEEDCVVPYAAKYRRWNHAYIQPDLPGTVDPERTTTTIRCAKVDRKRTNYAVLRQEISNAIQVAWGDEDILGTKPGLLVPRPQDGVLVPKPVVDFAYDQPTYLNHATAKQLEDALGKHRDIRDNRPDQRPVTRPDGTINPPGLGKPLDYVFPEGKSFSVDGFKVVYDVGSKWKFQIGFVEEAGLTIYNVRFVFPPSDAYPEGLEVPYIWKMNIPRFGTTYQNNAYGTLFGATYLESHQTVLADVPEGAHCRGSYITLPIYMVNNLAYEDMPATESKPAFYDTYGFEPMYIDPYAELLLGLQLPFNAFPFDRSYSRNKYGVLETGICIQEQDVGNGMWHYYSAQRLRSIAVYTSTVSEAYNVVGRFEFFSNGRIQVAENLHGYPAIMGSGVNVAGGAFASGGGGGFGSNHMHWSIVAITPHLKKSVDFANGQVSNKYVVSDLNTEHEANWYGSSYHRFHKTINSTSDADLMMYDFEKLRAWLVEAEDKVTGQSLGALKITSNSFGPPPMKSLTNPSSMKFYLTDYTEDETIMANWWFQRNVWILNEDNTFSYGTNPYSNANKLISEPVTPQCRLGQARRCVELKDEKIEDGATINVLMKIYHHVVSEELPVQNGFTHIYVDIWPHNLFGFNPNILIRQQPEQSQVWQNNYMAKEKQYILTYDDEF